MSGSTKYYKGQYFLAFYDKDGEWMKYMFDNIRDILRFQKKALTRQNISRVSVEIYRALRTDSHLTRFLTGEWLRVYMIDI